MHNSGSQPLKASFPKRRIQMSDVDARCDIDSHQIAHDCTCRYHNSQPVGPPSPTCLRAQCSFQGLEREKVLKLETRDLLKPPVDRCGQANACLNVTHSLVVFVFPWTSLDSFRWRDSPVSI